MIKEVKEELAVRRKMMILNYARETGKVTKICREFEVTRSLFYKWEKTFDSEGKAGLYRKKPIAYAPPFLLVTVRLPSVLKSVIVFLSETICLHSLVVIRNI